MSLDALTAFISDPQFADYVDQLTSAPRQRARVGVHTAAIVLELGMRGMRGMR